MSGYDGGTGFEQLARQYWAAFGDFARAQQAGQAPQGWPNAAPAVPTMPGWKEGLEWWTRMASPQSHQMDAALGRMNAQGGDWFGLMQQVAAQFAGRDASADQVSKAWQQALGGFAGPNGVADLFKRMAGPGTQGFEQWLAQIGPWLQMLQGAGAQKQWHEQISASLKLPTFGLTREHQARWQALAQAQLDYQQSNAAFSDLLARVGKRAFERFESRLEERSEPGRQLDSARALFDLWIDAAEEAWSEIALTVEFREIYGALANTQMRLRGAIQTEIELMTGMFGLPTRTEMDASHRKVAQLERELRKLRSEFEEAAHARRPGRLNDPPAAAAKPRPARAEAANEDVAPLETPTVLLRALPIESIDEPAVPKRKTATRKTAASRSKRRTAVLPTVAAPRAVDRRAPTPAKAKKKARK